MNDPTGGKCPSIKNQWKREGLKKRRSYEREKNLLLSIICFDKYVVLSSQSFFIQGLFTQLRSTKTNQAIRLKWMRVNGISFEFLKRLILFLNLSLFHILAHSLSAWIHFRLHHDHVTTTPEHNHIYVQIYNHIIAIVSSLINLI